jgi:chorismate mutase
MKILESHRRAIDHIDDQIVDLLVQRVDVVRAVAALKKEHHIHPVLPDRVEEVKTRTAARAHDKGIERAIVQKLYDALVDYSCTLEARLMRGEAEDLS